MTKKKVVTSALYDDTYEKTTCGESAFNRGPHQRVIGFSFYEKRDSYFLERRKNDSFQYPDYFSGIEKNLQLMPSHYPGWIVRLYYDLHSDDPLFEILEDYTKRYNYIDLCHIQFLPNKQLRGRLCFTKTNK